MKISYDEPQDERLQEPGLSKKHIYQAYASFLLSIVAAGYLYFQGIEHTFLSVLMLLLLVLNVFATAVMSGMSGAGIIRGSFSGPLKELSSAARKVAAGDFNVRVFSHRQDGSYDAMEALIEDFNKMVSELAANETLKGDFIANVSHELKTPLAIIKNYADALQSENLTEEQRQYYIATIADSAGKLSHLIENILRLNKMESQAIVEREEFSLDEQLRCCILALEEKFDEKELELDIDLEEEILLENDASLLEIAWNNLLGNAIKYTPAGGTIGISARVETVSDPDLSPGQKSRGTGENVRFVETGKNADGLGKRWAVVRISDTGCGMSEEVARHIFDKFYQGDTSHSSQGNGLGLAMVAKVMELCGGQIDVETREGKGSVFTVKLAAEGSR